MWTWLGKGDLPNVHITIQASFRKMVHKGTGGHKYPKNLSTWFMDDPLLLDKCA